MIPIVPSDAHGIASAADRLRRGEVIAYPTETVYGLGADPNNRQALKRIFSIKGRSPGKPLILLIRSPEDLGDLVTQVSPEAERLMAAFWPGPLTLVFPARPELPDELLGTGNSIALRVSGHPVSQALLDSFDAPLTSTSANRSGTPPCLSAQAACALQGPISLVLDGGSSKGGRPSTLLDVTRAEPVLLREGPIPEACIREILGK